MFVWLGVGVHKLFCVAGQVHFPCFFIVTNLINCSFYCSSCCCFRKRLLHILFSRFVFPYKIWMEKCYFRSWQWLFPESVHLKGFLVEIETMERKKNRKIQALRYHRSAHLDATEVEYFYTFVNFLGCQTWELWVNNVLLPDHSYIWLSSQLHLYLCPY